MKKIVFFQMNSSNRLVKAYDEKGFARVFYTDNNGNFLNPANSKIWRRFSEKGFEKKLLPEEFYDKALKISELISKAIRLGKKLCEIIERERRRVKGRAECEKNKRPLIPAPSNGKPSGKFINKGGATLGELCPELQKLSSGASR